MIERLYTPKEAADALDVPLRTLEGWIAKKQIRFTQRKKGCAISIALSELNRILIERGNKPISEQVAQNISWFNRSD